MHYKQTKNFSHFQCLGGECIHTCCYNWTIPWTVDEVDRVKKAVECSDNLSRIAESAFIPEENSKEKFLIRFNEKTFCPFQSEEKLCLLQKELGENVLSAICKAFPRKFFKARQTTYCFCTMACPAVLQDLIDNENAAVLLNADGTPETFFEVRGVADTPWIAEHPELKYHKELLEFFYEIISEKKHRTDNNVIRGLLAAHQITEVIKNISAKKIPGIIEELRIVLNKADILEMIENVEPDYELKLRMLTYYTEELFGSGLVDLFRNESGDFDHARYNYAENRLNEMMKERPFWLRNIALNLLFDLVIPFHSSEKSIYDNYCEYVTVFEIVKLCAVAAVMNDTLTIDIGGSSFSFKGMECITGLCSVVMRKIHKKGNGIQSFLDEIAVNGTVPFEQIARLV